MALKKIPLFISYFQNFPGQKNRFSSFKIYSRIQETVQTLAKIFSTTCRGTWLQLEMKARLQQQ